MIDERNFSEEFKKYAHNHPEKYVMVRSDRVNDPKGGKYKNDEERLIGDKAMRDWFEYLFDRNIGKTIRLWVSHLRQGMPVQAVCADPKDFDPDWRPKPYWSTPPRFFDKMMDERAPQAEFSEEHRAMMRQRFADLMQELMRRMEACTPRTCSRQYGQECPREDKRWCRSSDELVERGFSRQARVGLL